MAPIKFEEKLKEKLDKRTLSPSVNSWSKLAQRLDEEENKSKNSMYLWLSIAAGLLIMLAVSVQFFNKNETVPMWNKNGSEVWKAIFAAGLSQMQLSSSVSLFGKLQSKQKQYSANAGIDGIYHPNQVTTPGVGQDGFNKWVIETKFECPSINMAGMDTEALGAGSPGDGRSSAPGSERLYTKGIWKGYGIPPQGNEGIYFGLKESFPEKLTAEGLPRKDSLTGSLIHTCGFESTEKRIGEIASARKMYEAIVAVPLDKDNNPIPIAKYIFDKQKENLQNGKPAVVVGDYGARSDIFLSSITHLAKQTYHTFGRT